MSKGRHSPEDLILDGNGARKLPNGASKVFIDVPQFCESTSPGLRTHSGSAWELQLPSGRTIGQPKVAPDGERVTQDLCVIPSAKLPKRDAQTNSTYPPDRGQAFIFDVSVVKTQAGSATMACVINAVTGQGASSIFCGLYDNLGGFAFNDNGDSCGIFIAPTPWNVAYSNENVAIQKDVYVCTIYRGNQEVLQFAAFGIARIKRRFPPSKLLRT
jgi:hypothetical protein